MSGLRLALGALLAGMLLGALRPAHGAEADPPPDEPPPEDAPADPGTGPARDHPLIELPHLFQSGVRDTRFAVPDLAPDQILFARVDTPVVTIRPGMELIIDYTAFGQNDDSIAQVGRQDSGFEVRSADIKLNGEFGPKRRLGYKLGLAFNGFSADTGQSIVVTDVNISFALPRWRTSVRIGQMREDFSYEVVGSTATLPQSERILTPFASPVNTGLKVTHVLGGNRRATLTYGLFRDDWGEGDGGVALSVRGTMLVIDRPRHFLHLGVGMRRADIRETTRYTARPGVHAAEPFLDTGEFAASGTVHFGLEAHYALGPVSVIAEIASARPDVPDASNPVFRGHYVLGSWVLTGEHREYDRSDGSLKRIMPDGRWGAVEVVARLAAVNLDSNGIDGGSYVRLEGGANWWATTRWKFGMLYGTIWLDRFGETGRTRSLLSRLQWVF